MTRYVCLKHARACIPIHFGDTPVSPQKQARIEFGCPCKYHVPPGPHDLFSCKFMVRDGRPEKY